jgi:hypothetical protein
LQGFDRVLQVDGYTGYNRVKDRPDSYPIELAYCWEHARRKLFELTIINVAPIAEEGLKQIMAFYRIERKSRECPLMSAVPSAKRKPNRAWKPLSNCCPTTVRKYQQNPQQGWR